MDTCIALILQITYYIILGSYAWFLSNYLNTILYYLFNVKIYFQLNIHYVQKYYYLKTASFSCTKLTMFFFIWYIIFKDLLVLKTIYFFATSYMLSRSNLLNLWIVYSATLINGQYIRKWHNICIYKRAEHNFKWKIINKIVHFFFFRFVKYIAFEKKKNACIINWKCCLYSVKCV